MKVSVITPTYNRGYILPQCYGSLCRQTMRDFEWIVVDDGSTDNTESLVEGFIEESRIDIKYIRQPNGGKHRAHNTGVDYASGELCVCLDSDDMLTPNAIHRAVEVWESINIENAIGIFALRGNVQDCAPICSRIPQGLTAATMTTIRDKYGFEGDTVLFFKTDLLKKCKFREFDGEKFLPELNLYCDLDLEGPMILLDEVLYLCEYQPDGLTAKYHKLLYNNPKGTADTYYKMTQMASSYLMSLKYAIISVAYNNLLSPGKRIRYNRKRLTMLLARFAAPLFSHKYLK